MDWTAMPYFLAVARTGTLRAAAQKTGATHATVDRHIKALEEAYGVRLFDRTRGGMRLTVAGQQLLPMAEEAELAMNGAKARLTGLDGQAAGEVRVSVPPALAYSILPEILGEFVALHPEVKLTVQVTNRLQDLTKLEADVSIRLANKVEDDVYGRKLFQMGIGLYCSRQYLKEELPKAGPNGEGLTWIGWSRGQRSKEFMQATPYAAAEVGIATFSTWMQRDLVKQGLGFGFLPAMYAEPDEDLVQMPGTVIEPNRWLWILLHGELRKTRRVRVFVDFMADALRARRALLEGPVAPASTKA